jgi:hypothetical protein
MLLAIIDDVTSTFIFFKKKWFLALIPKKKGLRMLA